MYTRGFDSHAAGERGRGKGGGGGRGEREGGGGGGLFVQAS